MTTPYIDYPKVFNQTPPLKAHVRTLVDDPQNVESRAFVSTHFEPALLNTIVGQLREHKRPLDRLTSLDVKTLRKSLAGNEAKREELLRARSVIDRQLDDVEQQAAELDRRKQDYIGSRAAVERVNLLNNDLARIVLGREIEEALSTTQL